MFHFAFVHNRDSLESAMRMPANTARLRRGRKFATLRMIEQDERAKIVVVVIRKERTNVKGVADPVKRWCVVDARESFHIYYP